MKTFAAIAIGSVETEMRIYELSPKKGMKEIDRLASRLNLGADAYRDNKLDVDQVEELCRILNEFRVTMLGYKVDAYQCVATSALRELRSSMITKDHIEKQTGLKIQIISNSEQRFMDYKSIASESESFGKIIQNGTAIVDIGGNSMQISVFDNDKLVTTANIPMGKISTRVTYGAYAKNRFHYEQMVRELMNHEMAGFGKLYQKDRLIKNLIVMDADLLEILRHLHASGLTGKFRESESVYHVDAATFFTVYDAVMKLTPDEISRRYQVSADTGILVIQSMIFTRCLIEKLGIEMLWLIDVSICDGMCYDYGIRAKQIKSKHNFDEDIIAASRNIAKRYKSSSSHIHNLEELALQIFDRMKKISGLGSRERLLLQIAVILHNCGKYISLNNVSDCAYNIIMATEIIGLSHAERQIIANVVRFNTSEFAYYDALASISDVSRDEYLVIAKLTAILRLANSLDRSHEQKFHDASVSLKENKLTISIATAEDITLEKIAMAEQAGFFEEVFNVTPVISQKKKY